MQIDYLSELSNYIFLSKYARYNDKLGRRETLDEAVTRLEDMHLKHYSFLSKEDKEKVKWAFSLVRNKTVVPSMRSLQFGGKAIEAHNSRIFNCLHAKTKFITSSGVKSFEDFKDGDKTTVLTHLGNWKPATVRNYGKDYLFPIKIKRIKNEQTIYATKDHTWILKNGERTEHIKKGMLLRGGKDIFSEFSYENASPQEKLYWAYGFVFGDGTLVKSGKNHYSMVRLCGEGKAFNDRFTELGFSTSQPFSCGGDFIAYTGTYLKTPPNPEIDKPNMIKAFVAGYCDADAAKNRNGFSRGSVTKNKYYSIQASDDLHIDFIRKCFPVAGIYIVSEEDLTGQTTNYGTRPKTIRFRIFNSPNNQENSNTSFAVSEISEDYIYDDVWCLEVEDDKSFVFPSGLVTGNCSVRHVDSLRSFAEIFYLLLCGCGVGIGLSKRFLGRLPDLVNEKDKTGTVLTYVVEDTIEGWADSIEALLNCYFKNTPYTGRKIVFDYSRIRPKGAILKTGGGKAPGFKGLKSCHSKIKSLLDHVIEYHNQPRLKSVNAYDILMHCADAVLSGGIRRSATSVIFDKDDVDMMNAKSYFTVDKVNAFHPAGEETVGGYTTKLYETKVTFEGIKYEITLKEWELDNARQKKISWMHLFPQRGRSNNSVLLLRNETTLEEFQKIVSVTREFGEPGFVFGNHPDQLFNPCFEIGFIPVTDGVCGVQFCNLTSQNGSKITSKKKFAESTEAATIIGTLQAGYTDFPYLSKAAETLTREEALLGVSITGMMDNPDVLLNPENQKEMAELAKQVNAEWAKKLKINKAARITCVKPEGCMVPETQIKTSLGNKSLEEIFILNGYNLADFKDSDGLFLPVNEKIFVFDENNDYQLISNLFVNGEAETVSIEMDDGNTVEVTPNHKFKTVNGWVEAKNLTEKDEIVSF